MDQIHISRDNFPKSTDKVDGMKVLSSKFDAYGMSYEPDVVYREVNGRKLSLQLIRTTSKNGKLPAIVFIPGSAFKRQNVKSRVAQLCVLAMRGYFVALLEYTGSEDGVFPQFVLDAKAGIAFVKSHADEYGIDANQVFVMGDSSGAYTALMAGLTNGVTTLEDEISNQNDYSVKGILDFFGPTDMTTMNDIPADSPEGLMIGGFKPLERLDLATPTVIKNYLHNDKKYPPILMFHGSNDELVAFKQSCEFYEACQLHGLDATLYQIDGAHHGGVEFWSKEVLDLVDEFIQNNK